MSVETGTVVDPSVAPPVPTAEAATDIPQAPVAADAPSPAPEVPRAPKPESIALATFEDLNAKAKRKDEYIVNLQQEDGSTKPVKLLLEAIDGPSYDKLIEKCPPTRDQVARGMQANPEFFEPWLLQEVIVAPALTKEEWTSLRKKPEWSGGEWASLALRAQGLCMTGLDVPFNARG